MKLYATTTSERATKGQGGNQYLTIDVYVNDRVVPRYQIKITPEQLEFCERGYNEPLVTRPHADLFK